MSVMRKGFSCRDVIMAFSTWSPAHTPVFKYSYIMIVRFTKFSLFFLILTYRLWNTVAFLVHINQHNEIWWQNWSFNTHFINIAHRQFWYASQDFTRITYEVANDEYAHTHRYDMDALNDTFRVTHYWHQSHFLPNYVDNDALYKWVEWSKCVVNRARCRCWEYS